MTRLGCIVSASAYVPRLRLPREVIANAMSWATGGAGKPKGARSICNWDEDSLTMGVEAARGALPRSGAPVNAVAMASTTLPFADRSNAALAAACLDLGADVETQEFGGTLRAGTTALANAARREGRTLVVATDSRAAMPGSAQEAAFGHGAAALVIDGAASSRELPVPDAALASVLGTGHVAANFVDHYRMAGSDFDYALEERWVRDAGLAALPARAIGQALIQAGVAARDVRHFVMPGSAANLKRIAKSAGLDPDVQLADPLQADCGDTGSAHALLMLVGALERALPGELILLASFGQGVDALLLRVEPGVAAWRAQQRPLSMTLARRQVETQYTRYLSHAGLLQVDFGMRAERDNRTAQSVAWRKHEMLDAFRGGKCRRCAAVQFPLSRVCVNPDCRETDTQDSFRLADSTGRVKTFTEDWQAYSRRPPYVYGNVSFAEGGNLFMEFTDLDAGELAVGDSLRFVLRIKDQDALRGFRRYFWKAAKA